MDGIHAEVQAKVLATLSFAGSLDEQAQDMTPICDQGYVPAEAAALPWEH